MFTFIFNRSIAPIFVPVARTPQGVFAGELDRGLGAAARFIEALQTNPDSAGAFVSKTAAGGFDLHALREILPRAQACRWVKKAGTETSGAFTTRSLYVDDPERGRALLHLRMVREPDRHGEWKICAIDREDVPR